MTAAPSPSTTCPKCSSKMEFGLLADATFMAATHVGSERPLEWVRGTPKKSWFDLSFRTKPADRLQVATLRCTGCGYLELFAPASD